MNELFHNILDTHNDDDMPPEAIFFEIYALECDFAMEIQSFLFAKSKKIACGGH